MASLIRKPFERVARLYMTMLDRQPVFTKSLTSACMYGGGDILAQCLAPDTRNKPLDWRRVGVFCTYGFLVAGPLYHIWFNNLNHLPSMMMRARRYRQKVELRSLARRAGKFGIALPDIKPPKPQEFAKNTYLFSKVFADQFIFSPAYLCIFYYGTGVMSGKDIGQCTEQIKYVSIAAARPR